MLHIASKSANVDSVRGLSVSLSLSLYIYILYTYTYYVYYVCIYIYIHLSRERERERERETYIHIYVERERERERWSLSAAASHATVQAQLPEKGLATRRLRVNVRSLLTTATGLPSDSSYGIDRHLKNTFFRIESKGVDLIRTEMI